MADAKETCRTIIAAALNEFIKEKIMEIVTNMGLEPRIETKIREDNITFTICSDNNAILIGKNGRTIDAIQTIIRAILYKEINTSYNFTTLSGSSITLTFTKIDVSNFEQSCKASS